MALTPREQDAVGQLMKLLERFSDEDVIALVPVIALSNGAERFDDWAPQVQQLMSEFARRVGAEAGMTAEQFRAAIDAYYDENPLKPELATAFKHFVREQLGGDLSEAVGDEVSRLLAQPPRVVDNEPPPEGSVPAGPFARFRVGEKLDK